MKLLTSQKDILYNAIIQSNYFTPNQFEIKEEGDKANLTTVYFKDSEYYFRFCEDRSDINFFLNFCPGDDLYLEATTNLTFYEAESYFDAWLENLHREITSPNLWEQFRKQISGLSLASEFDNSKFTFNEFNDLSFKMETLINGLNSIPLLANQQEEIKNSIAHLIEMAKDSGKFDWKNLFIGTIISIIIQLGVTQENANAIWNLIKLVFSNYFLSSASH